MIHSCNKRKWYVDEYLVPSMVHQGIPESDIIVYNDDNNDGCLTSYIKSFKQLNGKGTWHLQDDVVISERFAELTRKHDNGVVCGFCNCYDRCITWGYVEKEMMWYSMPCIRIPDGIVRNFVEWVEREDIRELYKPYINANKHVDVLFQEYIQKDPDMRVVLNLSPNIVNHVDYLIGGSIINSTRAKQPHEIMAVYWEDSRDTIDRLERSLKNGR